MRFHSSDERLIFSDFPFPSLKKNNEDTNDGLSTMDRLAIPSYQNLLSFRPTTMHCIDNNDSNNYMNIAMMK